MARRKIPVIHDISFTEGPNAGLNVRVKSVKFGKVRQLMALMDDDDKDVETMDAITRMLADAIVSWDLEDEYGVRVAPSVEAIDDMEFAEVIDLVSRWLDKITGPSDGLGKGSTSGASFPGQPLTMEAL